MFGLLVSVAGLVASNSPCPPGLASWLCAATFGAPPIGPLTFDVGSVPIYGEVSATLTIVGLKCGSGRSDGINSSVALAGKPGPSLALGLLNVSFNCSTKDVELVLHGKGSGSKLATITAPFEVRVVNISLDALLAFGATDGLPSSAKVNVTSLRIPPGWLQPKIHIQGFWSILDGLLDSLVTSELTSMIPSTLLPLINSLAPKYITPLLRQLDAWVAAAYPPTPWPEPKVVAAHTELVDWADSDALRLADFVLNEVAGRDGPLGAAGLVRALTAGSGNVTLDNETIAALVPGIPTVPVTAGNFSLANLTFELRRVSVDGLADLSRLSLVTPDRGKGSAHTLDLRVGWQALWLRLSVGILATPLPGGLVEGAGVLDEEFELTVELSATSARLALLLALNQTYLASIAPDRLPHIGVRCLLAEALMLNHTTPPPVHSTPPVAATVAADRPQPAASDAATPAHPGFGVRAAELNVTVGRVSVSGASYALERQVDALIEHAATLVFGGFGGGVTRVADALVGGVVRDAVDKALVKALVGALSGPCPPAPPPTPTPPTPPPPRPALPGMVDWRKNRVRGLSEWAASELLAPLEGEVDKLLNSTDGRLSLDVDKLVGGPVQIELPLLGRFNLSIPSFELDGLDTFTTLAPFGVPPNTSAAAADVAALTSSLDAGRLGVTVSLVVTRLVPPGVTPSGKPLTLTLGGTLHNLSIAAEGRFALNGTELLAMPLAELAHPGCLARKVDALLVSELGLNFSQADVRVAGNGWGSMPAPGTAVGFSWPMAQHRSVLEGVQALLRWLRVQFNELVARQLAHPSVCPPASPPSPPTMVDLSSSRLVRSISTAVDALGDGQLETGTRAALKSLNRLLNKAFHRNTTWPAGSLPLPPLPFHFHDDDIGDVAIVLEGATLSGVDSLYDLHLLRTAHERPTELANSLSAGKSTPLALDATLHLRIGGQWQTFALSLSLRGLAVGLGLIIDLDLNTLGELRLEDLVLHPLDECLLRPLAAVLLSNVTTALRLDGAHDGSIHVSLRPVNVHVLGGAAAARRRSADRNASQLDISAFPPSLDAVLGTLVEALDDHVLSKLLEQPHHTCDVARGLLINPPPPNMPPSPAPPTPPLLVGFVVMACMVGFIICMVCTSWVCRKFRAAGEAKRNADGCDGLDASAPATLASPADLSRPFLNGGGSADGGLPSPSPGPDSCLAFHAPCWARYGFTAIVPVNVCLLLYANLQGGATVHVLINLAGQPLADRPVFAFGLFNSVHNFIASHSYALAILIAFLSAIWPYLKLLIMGLVWWAPPRRLSVARRGAVLRFLDATGKWSLVDTQMLTILMVALKFDIFFPSSVAGTPDFVNVKVTLTRTPAPNRPTRGVAWRGVAWLDPPGLLLTCRWRRRPR